MKKLNLAYLILLASLFACNNASNNSENKGTVPNGQTNTQPLDTVTRLGDLKTAKSAIFKAPNGKFYTITPDTSQYFEEDKTMSSNKSLNSESSNQPCDGNEFDGSDRKAAKLSVSDASVDDNETLEKIIGGLMPDDEISSKITSTDETSNRISDEEHNYKFKAWIYTFKRQGDEDYHVIIGTTDNIKTAKFLNAEISGLPAQGSTYYTTLFNARKQFYDFFGWGENSCEAKSYTKDYMKNPIEVTITGSLFFDKFHYEKKSEIGPSWARGDSYWEIHPITSIVFN
jgi:hypothetical protein